MTPSIFFVRLIHHLCRAVILLYFGLLMVEWLIPGLVLPFIDLVDGFWLIIALIVLSVLLPIDNRGHVA